MRGAVICGGDVLGKSGFCGAAPAAGAEHAPAGAEPRLPREPGKQSARRPRGGGGGIAAGEGLRAAKLDPAEVRDLPGADSRKVEIARIIWERTTVPQGWLAKYPEDGKRGQREPATAAQVGGGAARESASPAAKMDSLCQEMMPDPYFPDPSMVTFGCAPIAPNRMPRALMP